MEPVPSASSPWTSRTLWMASEACRSRTWLRRRRTSHAIDRCSSIALTRCMLLATRGVAVSTTCWRNCRPHRNRSGHRFGFVATRSPSSDQAFRQVRNNLEQFIGLGGLSISESTTPWAGAYRAGTVATPEAARTALDAVGTLADHTLPQARPASPRPSESADFPCRRRSRGGNRRSPCSRESPRPWTIRPGDLRPTAR